MKAIVERVGVSKPTVIGWKKRYAAEGIGGLTDRPKPGRPVVVDETQVDLLHHVRELRARGQALTVKRELSIILRIAAGRGLPSSLDKCTARRGAAAGGRGGGRADGGLGVGAA